MDKAFIVHGTGAGQYEHWFPDIKQKLEDEGIEVAVPEFPTPEAQNLNNWFQVLEYEDFEIDEETVLIGHSTGAVFILSVLEELDFEIEAAFLVSGFTGPVNNERFDTLNKSFAERDFDFESIKASAKDIYVYHSASDPYVPVGKAGELVADLEANFELIAGAGHFNTEAGYVEFPELWRKLQKYLD